MEVLISPKTDYLLEAGLNVLHFESREWISELEFMKRELDFFMKLMNSKVFTLPKEQQRQHIFSNMDKLCNTVVVEVEKEVKLHGKELADLMTVKTTDDAAYRARHKKLKEKVDRLNNDVRTLKMLVFDFVEHLN